jgi:hypothetical protein
MASVTNVTYTDDIDGKKADETVKFSLDGADYEIDLSKKNAAALRKAFAEFVSAARPIKKTAPAAGRGRRAAAPVSSTRSPKAELDAIRAWAQEAGVHVADRGRISQHVRELYAAAN